MARILIADDDAGFRESLRETLVGAGHEVCEARNGAEVSREMRIAAPDLLLLDLKMPGQDGLAILRGIKSEQRFSGLPVVVITAYASSDNTIDAMRLGAFDHLSKPLGRDDVLEVAARALAATRPLTKSGGPGDATGVLIGMSPAMREVQKRIGMAAASDATVLISGETGTGKEMVARTLHEKSDRAAGPYVAVNCAAIPADLLESELFGHVKGAFTGAQQDSWGRFRAAEGGTLLLDEIGDMSLGMQAKILRVLQERNVQPVGADRAFPVDVRILAATHRDLVEAVRAGQFREDLFYRLNVIPIALPPLRERLADILSLAEHFLAACASPPKVLSTQAAQRLLEYRWPGNVRELKNLMERLSVLARGNVIAAEDLKLDAGLSAATADLLEGDLPGAVARLEKAMIGRALEQAEGNRAEAARLLGIRRQLLYAKMRTYGFTQES